MIAVARGQVLSADNPLLHEFFVVDGVLTDVFSLEYVITSMPSDGSAGTQIFPAAGRQALDMEEDRLGTGHYAATGWTVPSDQSAGDYQVTWFCVVEEGDDEVEVATPFEVLATKTAIAGPLYASVASMRAEGFTSEMIADHALHAKLVAASLEFEAYTQRFFEPRYKQLTVDGSGKRDLLLNEPIIGIESVTLLSGGDFANPTAVDLASLRVYNRHLTQGLLSPDDRENPRIAFSSIEDSRDPELSLDASWFSRGTQNIQVYGLFGYTEPDGTATGGVPVLAQMAVRLLALRNMPQLVNTDAREDARQRWMVTMERTRDQQISRFSGVDAGSRSAVIGSFTGDPQIDNLILLFKRGLRLGAA